MIKCNLRFVNWDADSQAYVGVPEGNVVEAVSGFEGHDVRAVSHTNATGAVEFEFDTTPNAPTERWFRCLTEPVFETRHAASLDDPDRSGRWSEVLADIGSDQEPVVFDVNHKRLRRVRGNDVELLVDGPAVLACLENRIAKAKKSIHLQTQFFYNDDVGNKLTDLLIDKARNGVAVRVMFDRHATSRTASLIRMKQYWLDHWIRDDSPTWSGLREQVVAKHEAAVVCGDTSEIVARLDETVHLDFVDASIPDVELRPRHVGTADAVGHDFISSLPIMSVTRMDHSKLAVFDGRAAILGGHNVGDDYMYDRPFDPASVVSWELGKFHDVSIIVDGPIVQDLQDLFRIRWMLQGGEPFDAGTFVSGHPVDTDHRYYPSFETGSGSGVPVQIALTTPGRWHDFEESLLKRMDLAEREILFETPFFANSEIAKRLIAAAKRGVRAVLILPDCHNTSYEYLFAGRMAYHKLLRGGVEVHEYKGRMLHAKVGVIDDTAIVGSVNLNNGSMRYHYELAAFIDDPTFARRMRTDVFDLDLACSRQIWPDDVKELLNIAGQARLAIRGLKALDVWF